MLGVLLRAQILMRRLHATLCATHSHSAAAAFAVAKATGLSGNLNGDAITSTISGIVKRSAFANPFCER